jgi:hypothetical protein
MKSQRVVITLLFVLAVSPLSFASLITPGSAAVDLHMTANAGCGTVSSSQYEDWITNPPVLGNLTSSVSAAASCTGPNRKLTTSGDVTATWTANTKKGTIKFNNIGWTANNNVTNGAAVADAGLDYTYTFTPTTAIDFTLTYNITANGNNTTNAGLNGFFITLSGGNWSGLFGLGTSGTLTALLAANQSYTLTIQDDASISGNIAGAKSHMDGKFNWVASTPVPEPSSMLMLGSGILALAGALRKKMIG